MEKSLIENENFADWQEHPVTKQIDQQAKRSLQGQFYGSLNEN